MNGFINFITKIVLALGLRGRLKEVVNVIVDIAIKEGKEEIDLTSMFSDEEKVVAKNGVDLLAARLKTLINEEL